MINEIYVNEKLVLNESPKKKFKNGYKIRCLSCGNMIERKWYDKKILETPYECKSCVLKNKNPMHNPIIKKKHDFTLKSEKYRDNMRKLTTGEKNGFYGKSHTKQTIQKIIEANKEYWVSMTEDKRLYHSVQASNREKKKMEKDPIGYRKKRAKAARISHIKQFQNMQMNGIEKKVYDYINTIEPSIEYSVILASYQFDFGIKHKKILIEVDGDYWHGNPKFYNRDGTDNKKRLNEIQLRKIKMDDEKTEWAQSRGFMLIRLWEDEIKNDTFKDIINSYLS